MQNLITDADYANRDGFFSYSLSRGEQGQGSVEWFNGIRAEFCYSLNLLLIVSRWL